MRKVNFHQVTSDSWVRTTLPHHPRFRVSVTEALRRDLTIVIVAGPLVEFIPGPGETSDVPSRDRLRTQGPSACLPVPTQTRRPVRSLLRHPPSHRTLTVHRLPSVVEQGRVYAVPRRTIPWSRITSLRVTPKGLYRGPRERRGSCDWRVGPGNRSTKKGAERCPGSPRSLSRGRSPFGDLEGLVDRPFPNRCNT